VDQAGALREMKRTGKNTFDMNPLLERKARSEQTRVIAITSGKGGVGKTHIAANVAYYLASMGKKILLLDADAGLANIDVVLGITPKYNLCHVLNGEKSLADILVRGPAGMKILPGASGIRQMADLSTGHKLTLLEELDDLNESVDFMFIDTAAGITGNVMYFNMVAKEIVVVLSPEPTSLTDAYALIKLLYQGYRAKRFSVLVNMAKDSAEAKAVHRRLSNATDHFLNLSIEYLGYIPFDQNVQKAAREQRAVGEFYPLSKASKHLYSIAEKLSREQTLECDNGTIKFFGNAIIDRCGE